MEPTREPIYEENITLTFSCVQILLCLFGIVTNILNIKVFKSKRFKMTKPILIHFLAISISDLLVALIVLPHGFLYIFLEELDYYKQFYVSYIFRPFANIFYTCSSFFTVSLTIERFIFLYFIKHPGLNSAKSIQKHVTFSKVSITISSLLSLLFGIPYFFSEIMTKESKSTNTKEFHLKFFDQFEIIRPIVCIYIPVIVVALVNVYLSYSVWKTKKMSQNLFSQRHRNQGWYKNNTTLMLISITMIFVLSNIFEPFAHPSVFKKACEDCNLWTSNNYVFTRQLINSLQLVNVSNNFFSFLFFNELFLNSLKFIFNVDNIEKKEFHTYLPTPTKIEQSEVSSKKNSQNLVVHM